MRKIKYYLVLLLIFFITGCSSYDMSMKISEDKSMVYTLTILSNSYNSALASNISIYKDKFEQYGYFVSEYNDGNKYGMIVTKEFDNIDDISYGNRSDEFNLLYLYNDGYNQEVEKKMFNLDEGFYINRYAANFYVDLSNLGINLSNAEVKYSVELPNKSFSNNANLVSEDGKKLTWNITSLGKSEIDYVFELNSYDNIYFGIAVIIAIFLIFLIISRLFSKGNGKDDEESSYSGNFSVDKKIENLTNNAINNSNNNVVVNKNKEKIDNVNFGLKKMPLNREYNDDITTLHMPEKRKGLFGEKKNSSYIPIKTNDNDEFNAMINNMNNNIIKNTDLNVEKEIIPDPFGKTNLSNVNINKEANNTILEKTEDLTLKNMNKSLDINNIDGYRGSDILGFEPVSITNDDNNIKAPSQIVSDNNDDLPIIRVNSKSISVNNDKREE